MHEFPGERHPEVSAQCQHIRHKAREQAAEVGSIGGEATEGTRAENAMGVHAEQIVGTCGQVGCLDQLGGEVVTIVRPPCPVAHPLGPVGEGFLMCAHQR